MIKKFQKSLSSSALSCSSSSSLQIKNSLQIRTKSLDTQSLLNTTEKSEYDSEGRIELYTKYITSLRAGGDNTISQNDINQDVKNKIPEALALYAIAHPASRSIEKIKKILDDTINDDTVNPKRKENLEYLKEKLK